MYENLDSFERALAHFGTRVEIIIALEMGGKLDADSAYKNIKYELFQVVKYFRSGFSYYCLECSKPKPRD
jgi:hypothetical protein